MKHKLILLIISSLSLLSCTNRDNPSNEKLLTNTPNENSKSICAKECKAENKSSELSCKLTTPELQIRKETILKNLKK